MRRDIDDIKRVQRGHQHVDHVEIYPILSTGRDVVKSCPESTCISAT